MPNLAHRALSLAHTVGSTEACFCFRQGAAMWGRAYGRMNALGNLPKGDL